MALWATESCAVLVFLRAPDMGRVKTRLARSLGDEAALGLYRCFVADLLARLKETGFPLRICYTPADAGDRIADWLGAEHPLTPQHGADLGMRMGNAFHRVFRKGASRALLVGSDIPDLPGERIVKGFEMLATHPAVVGPTPDGGYFLIGFRSGAFAPEVFEGQRWGTPAVLKGTISAFRRLKQRPYLLDSWPDIDTVEDLAALMKRALQAPAAAPETLSFLRERFPSGLADEAPDPR